MLQRFLSNKKIIKTDKTKINLCCGSILLSGFLNIDISSRADVRVDLEEELLPLPSDSFDVLVCISSINYFTRARAQEIVHDVFRVLRKGGVARFASQDLMIIAQKYVHADKDFYFEKLPDGRDRFEGPTMADKFNSWFYGYKTNSGKTCKYVYDYESLELLFQDAGFRIVERKKFMESRIEKIELIDNRPEQMFFLEAVK